MPRSSHRHAVLKQNGAGVAGYVWYINIYCIKGIPVLKKIMNTNWWFDPDQNQDWILWSN